MAVDGRGNGIRMQAIHQLEALCKLGHDVVPMQPWEEYDSASFDVVQFFLGGFSTYGLERRRQVSLKKLVFAPIIDTNEPFWRYRIAANFGRLIPKIFTVPGVFRSQADCCDLVICRSSYERNRIVKGLGVSPDKCRVVLNGVAKRRSASGARAKEQLEFPDNFLLHVGAYTQARKNVLRLAYAALEVGKPLVIAGRSDPGPTLAALLDLERRNPKKIRVLPYMARDQLEDLYDACKVFCLPSYHEGTGLVALEAANYGSGIVITKNGGPPDYFGKLAYYVDPFSVGSIARAIDSAWEKPRQKELQSRMEELTWEASANELLSAYRSVF
jgi:glycosyltransferase involved in cell wall biosynthesis